uniref:Uncharacterized protein n=1 Tax=Arion vulgaris TaxID=1028688 RepID=A0A0B7BBQ7_9EUPU
MTVAAIYSSCTAEIFWHRSTHDYLSKCNDDCPANVPSCDMFFAEHNRSACKTHVNLYLPSQTIYTAS